ncbi:MAG: hypothetical protein RBS57_00360, partial [Desulforhabdus sp.]|nr:hypothetical protein [Desulforhabdus sp.]
MTLHYWLARLGQRIQWSWLRVIGAISFFPLGLGIVVWPTATLIYVLVFLLLLLTFIQPYVALILTFLCIGFQGSGFQYYFQGWSWVVPGYTVPVLFGLTAWSAARIAGIIEPHRSTTLDLPLLVLWVTGLLALTWSRYWFDGVHVLVMHTTSYALFLLISLNCRAPVQAISLYWVWWGLGLVMVGIIITSFFTGYAYSQYLTENLKFFSVLNQADGSRNSFHGTMSVTKGVTFVMNHAIFCALAIIGTRKNRWAITIAWSSIVAFLFVHLLTQSRLELVGLCLGWAVFVYLMPQWWESKLQKSTYAFITLAAGLMLTLAVLHTFFNLTEFVARFTGREATLPGTPFSAA